MNDRIWNIIAANLHGEEITPEEERELREWLEQGPENRTTYRMFEQFYKENAGLFAGTETEREQAWQENRTRLACRRSQLRRKVYRRWASAASILLVIGLTSIWHFSKEKTVPLPLVAETEIQPGSPKAVLTLASGETLNLQGLSQKTICEHTGVIRNENNTLAYASTAEAVTAKLEFNRLDIPRGGEYQLILEDGTKVWLNSDTRLRYPVAFGKKERRIYLEGEAYFQVKKDPARPFIVSAEGVDVTALGTEFNVSCGRVAQKVYTTLVEGSVRVASEQGKSCVLKPAEQAVCGKGNPTPEVHCVNPALYTSWKDGYYMFERQMLGEIMSTLARWYDIKVLFADQEVSQLRFSGRLKRYDDISNFLSMIRLTGDANFEMNGKTIIVRKKINRK